MLDIFLNSTVWFKRERCFCSDATLLRYYFNTKIISTRIHLDFYDNGAALTYKTLLQRIKTSPRFPESWPSMYSSVSANWNQKKEVSSH